MSQNSNMSSVQALNREVKIIAGQFSVDDSDNAVTKVQGLGFSVARLDAGVYAVDLEDSYPYLLAGIATVQSATAADLIAQIKSYDVKATATASLTNQTIVYTANNAGRAGNAITIELVDPAGNDQALSISVVGTAISVSLATGGAGAITTTRAQLVAALMANSSVTNLITVSGSGASAMTAISATPLAGGANRGMILNVLAGSTPTEADMAIQFQMLLRNTEIL